MTKGHKGSMGVEGVSPLKEKSLALVLGVENKFCKIATFLWLWVNAFASERVFAP